MLADVERQPNRDAVINDLCAVLSRRYGTLKLSTRVNAARAAMAVVDGEREQHAVWLRRQLIAPVEETPDA